MSVIDTIREKIGGGGEVKKYTKETEYHEPPPERTIVHGSKERDSEPAPQRRTSTYIPVKTGEHAVTLVKSGSSSPMIHKEAKVVTIKKSPNEVTLRKEYQEVRPPRQGTMAIARTGEREAIVGRAGASSKIPKREKLKIEKSGGRLKTFEIGSGGGSDLFEVGGSEPLGKYAKKRGAVSVRSGKQELAQYIGRDSLRQGIQRVKTSRPAKATVKALDMTYGRAFSIARASRAHNAKGERVSVGSPSDVSALGRASRGYARASRRQSSFSAELRGGYRSPNEFGLGLLGKRVSHPYAQKARTSTRLTAYDPMTGATAAPSKPRRRRRRKKTSGTAAPHDNVFTFF